MGYWAFRSRPGTRALVVRGDGSSEEGRLCGLYVVGDGAANALVVALERGWFALRRQGSVGWVRDADGRVDVEVIQVPVSVWPVPEPPDEAEGAGFELPGPPERPEQGTVQTNKLEGQW